MTILLLLLFFQHEAIGAPAPITLKDAVRSALEKTESVPIGQTRINQSEARVSQARSRFFPVLSFGASYQQQDTGGVLSRQSSALFGGSQSFTRLSLTQQLFDGLRNFALLKTSQSEREIERQNLTAANYEVFTTVARSFYAILAGERDVENLKKTIGLTNDRTRELANRVKIGRSRNIELTASRAQLSVLEAQLMAAEGQLITAWDQFILLTELPREVKLTQKRETPSRPEKLETYLGLIDRRPDVAAIQAQIQGAKNSVKAARAGHLPSLAVNGNYYLTREGTQKGNNWDVGATLTFPLFAGGIVRAQVKEAKEKASEAELLLRRTRRQAEISVRTAYNSLSAAINQVDALESALRSTEENFREQEKNYRFGQATNLDVMQALNSFLDTKRTLDRTRFLAFSAWAELKAATAQVSLAKTGTEGDE